MARRRPPRAILRCLRCRERKGILVSVATHSGKYLCTDCLGRACAQCGAERAVMLEMAGDWYLCVACWREGARRAA